MAQDLVDDDFQPERVGALDEGVEILEGAEQAVDVYVIGDVVAHVLLRGFEEG